MYKEVLTTFKHFCEECLQEAAGPLGASVLLNYGHEHELDEETFRVLLAAAEFGHQYGLEKAEA